LRNVEREEVAKLCGTTDAAPRRPRAKAGSVIVAREPETTIVAWREIARVASLRRMTLPSAFPASPASMNAAQSITE
jgi:hypothetical protein